MFQPCLRAVEIRPQGGCEVLTPSQLRKPPDAVIFTFSVRMPCSAWLLVKGTAKLNTKRSTAALWSRSRCRRLWSRRLGERPRAPGWRTNDGCAAWKERPRRTLA